MPTESAITSLARPRVGFLPTGFTDAGKTEAARVANRLQATPERRTIVSTVMAALRPIPIPPASLLRSDPGAQAFMLLRIAFAVAPILFGLDKFAEVLFDNWPAYLATEYDDVLPGSAEDAMYIVGVVEIVAGLIVFVTPRFGGLLVAAWLAGIIVSLLLVGGYGDIALRDFGLLVGALALSRLASAYSERAPEVRSLT